VDRQAQVETSTNKNLNQKFVDALVTAKVMNEEFLYGSGLAVTY